MSEFRGELILKPPRPPRSSFFHELESRGSGHRILPRRRLRSTSHSRSSLFGPRSARISALLRRGNAHTELGYVPTHTLGGVGGDLPSAQIDRFETRARPARRSSPECFNDRSGVERSQSAPRRAIVCSTRTEPRRRTTSSAAYSRPCAPTADRSPTRALSARASELTLSRPCVSRSQLDASAAPVLRDQSMPGIVRVSSNSQAGGS